MATIIKPIFIIGCGRSGTTLLFNLFKHHPQLKPTTGYPDGEDHLNWIKHGKCLIGATGRAERDKGHTGYHYCLYMDEHDLTPEAVQQMSDYYFNEVLEGDSSKRVVNKCPHLSNKLRYVRAMFPDAKFVHIVRDCLPVVSSWIEVMKTLPQQVLYWPDCDFPCFWPLDAPEHISREEAFKHNDRMFPGGGTARLVDYWSTVNRNIPTQLMDDPRQLFMFKYEDLCRSPQETLQKLCEFCELEPYPSPLPFEIWPDRNMQYKRLLTKDQIKAFLARAHATRVFFDYARSGFSLT